jgi:hypothetical protein
MTETAGRRVGVALLGGFAGASAWISLGTLALTDAAARTRLGALPPLWALIALTIFAAALAVRMRLPLARAWPFALTLLVWLPWLPMHVPRAFLLWDGPLEILVWATVALTTIISGELRPPSGLATWLGSPRRGPRVAVAIALACFLAGAAAIAERMPAGDEPHYLVITQSLLSDLDLRVENNHARGDYRSYYPFDLRQPHFMRRGTDGQIYSVHLPGISVLVLPAFAVAGYIGALVFVALVAAVGGALAWHAAWLLTGSTTASWTAWAAVMLSPPMFFNAFAIYPDGTAATVAMFVVWLLVRMHLGHDVMTPRWLIAAGVALGSLPWLHSRFAIVSAGLGLAIALRLLGRSDRVRMCTTFLAVPAVAAVAWFGYFWIIYGAPDPSLPYNGFGQNRIATLKPGVPGLLFDQQFGLVSNAPVFAVALLGVVSLGRRAPRLALEIGLTGLAYFLAVASYVMWWAGFSAPARFLLILLWPAVLPIAWVWQRSQSIATRAVIVATILLGAALIVTRAAVEGGLLVYNVRDGYDLLLDWASRTVNLPLAFPSLHRDVVITALGDIAIWIACGAGAYAMLVWLGRHRPIATGTICAASGSAAALALMVVSTAIWTRHGERPLTSSTSQLAFLQAWNPAWRTIVVKLRPTGLVAVDRVVEQLELSTATRRPQMSQARDVRPLLDISRVPAGKYMMISKGTSRVRGRLRVSVGRTPRVLEAWSIEHGASPILDLPVQVHSVTIDGDEDARALVASVSLRPLRVIPPWERPTDDQARRAATYGPVRVFFLDDEAFMEESGFWTCGDAHSRIVIDRREPGAIPVRIRNGPVPNELEIESGDWQTRLPLAPGEVKEMALPAAREPSARVVGLETRAGFIPSKVDAQSTDLRKLGVWVEFPDQ